MDSRSPPPRPNWSPATTTRGLGVPAILGRTLSLDDDRVSAPEVAVISHRYWESRFGRNPAVIGKIVHINRVPTAIVGVTPQGFDGAMQAGDSPDVTVPLAHHLRFQPNRAGRAQAWYWWIRIMGRLAPGTTAAQAGASLEPIFQEAARDGWLAGASLDRAPAPMPDDSTLAADPGARGENDMRRQYARSLRMLMGLVSLVLAGACANVANLLLARGAGRRARSRCGSRSAPAGAASCGSCSRNRWCSPARAPRSVPILAWWGRGAAAGAAAIR